MDVPSPSADALGLLALLAAGVLIGLAGACARVALQPEAPGVHQVPIIHPYGASPTRTVAARASPASNPRAAGSSSWRRRGAVETDRHLVAQVKHVVGAPVSPYWVLT